MNTGLILTKSYQYFLENLKQRVAAAHYQATSSVNAELILLYHLKLRCFVVIELKNHDFKPEYAGKMNFYLSAVDDLIKHTHDEPSIGLIICKSKNNVLVEYSLRDMPKHIGLPEYQLSRALPEKLNTVLPSIEVLEAELSKNIL